ncbi:MAG TPA: phosphoribosylamine--glycine ligase [Planctomycetes bacterium]|nr:phosphoribosylamine--glycine ligase [Planctomycetota bacterium]
MNILVVGSGAREHTLVWKLAQSPRADKIYCAPGNGGIASIAECVDIAAGDVEKLVEFAKARDIGLTVVGPEAPLCAGIVDEFEAHGLRAFGPRKAAAALEGDKAFSKDIMTRHSIPTAAHRVFHDPDAALAYVEEAVDYPMVVKASGLAAGKGVIICESSEDAVAAIRKLMLDKAFGAAGRTLVIEDFLEGEEASIIALTDGETLYVMESSQDHKRAFDGDKGPNTGGMGAYSPAPVVTADIQHRIEREVLVPVIHAMKREGRPFRGVLYAGLMLTKKGPKVLEFNVRFGDPECQVLLPRLKADLVDLFLACLDGTLADASVDWDPRPALGVVLAQEGYPGAVPVGRPLRGLDGITPEEALVFHGGTRRDGEQIVATGGRVLTITALGDTLREAREKAYDAIGRIDPEGFFYRRDIGARAL